MQGRKNPFDRDPHTVPLIRFVLHSNSLADKILTQGNPSHRLVRLNSFKEIEVIPLPTANNDLRKRFTENGLVFTEYYSHEAGVALRVSDGSIHDVITPFKKQLPDNFWEPIIQESNVTLADLFASNIGDFLVVAATDPSLKCKVAGDNIITAEQALEIVRIILTAHGHFYITAGRSVNEGFYYLYRFKKLFQEFQNAWTVAVYAHQNGSFERTYDYLASLGTRLELICRAYDKVAYFSQRTANNDNQRTQLYHFVYFVMLITSVFDGLAHVIKEFYQMDIKRRRDISLRMPEDNKDRKSSRFYQVLQSMNASLYEFLAESNTQSEIKAFYPLRDSLQHRELPEGAQLHQSPETRKNVFELNSESYERLKGIPDSPNFIIRGNPCFLDPYPFSKWAQEVLTGLVNRVLSSIHWDSVCLTLPPEIQHRISASNESYKQGLGQLLGWPEEPLYF